MIKTFVIILLFLVFFFKSIHALAILQQKDYIRLRIFTDKNINKINNLGLIFFILSLNIFFLETNNKFHNILDFIYWLMIILSLIFLIIQKISILKRQFKRPKLTLRAIFIFSTLITISLILILISPYKLLVTSLLITFNLFLIIGVNFITKFPVFFMHRKEMSLAKKNLYSIPGIKVIGITGSYGKSTTKQFLNTILKEQYKIISTPKSINTDIGIARIINSQINKLKNQNKLSEIKFVVLEMDAYVKGTLKRLTKYFPIDLAIITSINEQHLETFGNSIENTKNANFEMLQGIRGKNKQAIFNYNNKYCRHLAHRFQKELNGQIYFYGISQNNNNKLDNTIQNKNLDATALDIKEKIKPGKNKIIYKLKFGNKIKNKILNIELPVLGTFNALNFTGAALASILIGSKDEQIINAAKKVKIKNRTLDLKLTDSNLEIIDDSFNANPDGVRSIIKLIDNRNKILPKKNIIFFTGLYDLGNNSKKIHKEIGNKIIKIAHKLILTNPSLAKEIKLGINKNNWEKKVIVYNKNKSLKNLENKIFQNKDHLNLYRIIIINRIPAKIYNYLCSL